MHHSDSLCGQHSGIWAHSLLVDDGVISKTCNIEVFGDDGLPLLSITGVHYVPPDKIHSPLMPIVSTLPCNGPNVSKDVGIIAMEYYCPDLCIEASAIEDMHGCKGQYTKGRGQNRVTFCSDDEDAVSMAMTSLTRLMNLCNLKFSDIGRLEVGTESQVDRAKSIKSFLMSLFEESGCHDVVGADTYNACYGGTNALFNAISWVQGDSWNGKYAIVICSDAAIHPDRG